MRKEHDRYEYYWKDSILYQQEIGRKELMTLTYKKINQLRNRADEIAEHTSSHKWKGKLYSNMKQEEITEMVRNRHVLEIDGVNYIADCDGDIYIVDWIREEWNLLPFSSVDKMNDTYELFTELLVLKDKYTEKEEE